jgi:ATP-dependent DNA ligase
MPTRNEEDRLRIITTISNQFGGQIVNQLASPVDQPPEGKHRIHEIKDDGYRCQVLP